MEKKNFYFKDSMTEKVLHNYLSRAVTFQGLCAEGPVGNVILDEDIRMLLHTGAKFISRASLFAWTTKKSEDMEKHFQISEMAARQIHHADSEIILQGFVAEIVHKSMIDDVKIPAWVFEAFGHKAEERNFRFYDIMTDSKGPNFWAPNSLYPDYSKQETLYWYYYCACRYIDIGFESIHIQESHDESELEHVALLLNLCREYAKNHARRGVVLFHSFFKMETGGDRIAGRLLFDIHGNGLVPNETEKEVIKGQEVLKSRISYPYIDEKTGENYWCTWFGRSAGGLHPLGFETEIAPTILELDNYGQQGELGVSNGPAFGTWGYDDITWFAVQPRFYRDEFLVYLDEYMKSNCLLSGGRQAYFPVYPMRRCLTAEPNFPKINYLPGDDFDENYFKNYVNSIEEIKTEENLDGSFTLTSHYCYRANNQSDKCPNGFGQEDTIRKLFSGN